MFTWLALFIIQPLTKLLAGAGMNKRKIQKQGVPYNSSVHPKNHNVGANEKVSSGKGPCFTAVAI